MTKRANTSLWFWLSLFCIFAILVYLLRSILLPFAAGIIIGYLFDPVADRLEKWHINRTLATIIVLIGAVLIIIPAGLAILHIADVQLRAFLASAPKYVASLNAKLTPFLTSLQETFPALGKESISSVLQNNLSNSIKILSSILQKLITGSFAIVNVISLLLITPVVAFYMLRDWDHFVKKIDELLPRAYRRDIREQAHAIDHILSSFIRGQFMVCLSLGAFYAIGLGIVGLDLGLMVGMIAGIISFIPYVGSITGFVLSMLIAFAQFNTIPPIIAVVAIFIAGQLLEGNFLTPKLVGDSVGLHPVWVMFALLAGGVLLGFLGLMIAVPVAAVIGVLLRYWINRYKQSTLYKN